ncbi:helix-turn-helix domain-containing protein [Tahibacter sp.]|uniref:MarR family winged helix-turn-helix transcriptional regulator n=1 Tax=Tahibacter sp. TaxID=2056211 RepID=UPI0028C4FF86|nr:helix-turn-helix domain-containing protein [Tahibacter sp.]
MQTTLRSPRAVKDTSDDSGQPGGASVGALLRRLSELIDRDANRAYTQAGIVFEPRWMGVLNLLAVRGAMSVNELAAVRAISHPSVSQTRKSGLVAEHADRGDGRRRPSRLFSKGAALVETLQPIGSALAETAKALNAEADDVVAGFARLERAPDRRPRVDRVQARVKVGARRGPSRVARNSTARQRVPAIDSIVPQRGTTSPRLAIRGMAHAARTVSKDSP